MRETIEHAVLFVIFFCIGAAGLTLSVLSGEINRYYQHKDLLKYSRESLSRLDSLNADYDALLEQLKKNPAIIARMAPLTLGKEPNEPNTVYPKAMAEELNTARQILTDNANDKAVETGIPGWAARCNMIGNKGALFLCGSFLIIISFVFFSGPAPAEDTESHNILSE